MSYPVAPGTLVHVRLNAVADTVAAATFCGTVLALVLGLVLTILRLAEIPVVSRALDLIVQFLRGTPFLIQLYFLFYALPQYGFALPPFLTGVITTGMDSSSVAPAAASSRSPSGSVDAYHRYGTRLRARKSRTSKDREDQRWPITFVSGTGA